MYFLASSRARLSAVLTVVTCGAGWSGAPVFSITPTGRSSGILVCGRGDSGARLALALCLESGSGLGLASLVLTVGCAPGHCWLIAPALKSTGLMRSSVIMFGTTISITFCPELGSGLGLASVVLSVVCSPCGCWLIVLPPTSTGSMRLSVIMFGTTIGIALCPKLGLGLGPVSVVLTVVCAPCGSWPIVLPPESTGSMRLLVIMFGTTIGIALCPKLGSGLGLASVVLSVVHAPSGSWLIVLPPKSTGSMRLLVIMFGTTIGIALCPKLQLGSDWGC